MQLKTQFIYDDEQQPLFAILPFAEYKRLISNDHTPPPPKTSSLLAEDGLSITLPNGGPDAKIDLPLFVDFWLNSALLSMPINQRAKKFEEFPTKELISLEPLIRGCFLKKDSSYRNTMQATTSVVAALVETGMFREVRFYQAQLRDGHVFNRKAALVPDNAPNTVDVDEVLKDEDLHRYSRTVKCLELITDKALEFNKLHPIPRGAGIPGYWYYDPRFTPDFLRGKVGR